jgi:hypothetical protein
VLTREEFVFTIGYDGPAAVVDKQAQKKYGKLTTRELAEKGLFRAAYSSAVYSKDPNELKYVAESYKRLGGQSPGVFAEGNLSEAEVSALDRLFGIGSDHCSAVDVKRSVAI